MFAARKGKKFQDFDTNQDFDTARPLRLFSKKKKKKERKKERKKEKYKK